MHKIKLYCIFLFVIAITFGVGFLILFNLLSPTHAPNVILFYFLFSGCVFSLTTLAGYYLRRRLGHRELFSLYFQQSVRQGLWFTILLLVSLILLSREWFTWLNAGFLMLTLVCLEAYILTKNDRES